MPLDYTLRPAKDSDLAFFRYLRFRSMKPYIEPLVGWDFLDEYEYAKSEFQPKELKIIEYQGIAIGSYCFVECNEYFELKYLRLLPSYQNHGVGSDLIAKSIFESNGKTIEIYVLRTNPAINLYRRFGFITYETVPLGYNMRHEGV